MDALELATMLALVRKEAAQNSVLVTLFHEHRSSHEPTRDCLTCSQYWSLPYLISVADRLRELEREV